MSGFPSAKPLCGPVVVSATAELRSAGQPRAAVPARALPIPPFNPMPSAPVLLREAGQQLLCVQSAFGGFFMLEVSEHITSGIKMLLNAVDHGFALVGRVGGLAKAVIDEVRRRDFGRVHLFGLGDT